MRTELFLVGFLLERAFLLGRSALLAWGSGGARGAGLGISDMYKVSFLPVAAIP